MIKEVRALPTFSAPIARHRLAFAPSPPHPASVVPRAHATVAHSPSSSSSPVPPTPLRQLREKTGAPLMDVKKALAATEFDMEAAHAELRKRGLAAAGKKAGRVAADGLVGVKVSDCGRYAGAVEVNSETDFVSRNEHFLALVANAAAAVVKVDVGTLGNPAPGSAAEIPLAALEALPLPTAERRSRRGGGDGGDGSRKHSTPPRVRHGGDGRRRGHRTLRARRGGARYGSPGGAREGYGR